MLRLYKPELVDLQVSEAPLNYISDPYYATYVQTYKYFTTHVMPESDIDHSRIYIQQELLSISLSKYPFSIRSNVHDDQRLHFWTPWVTSWEFRADVMMVVVVLMTDGYLATTVHNMRLATLCDLASPWGSSPLALPTDLQRFLRIATQLPYELQVQLTSAVFGLNRTSIVASDFDEAAQWLCTYMDDSMLWFT